MDDLGVGITALWLVVAGVLGLVAGGVACRWERCYLDGAPPSRPRCAACGRRLAARDLVPVIGWAMARGRCRSCGEGLPWRQPAAELACCAAFVAIATAYGPSLQAFELLAFTAILLFLSLTDLDDRIIPNGCIVAAVAVRAAYLAALWVLGRMGGADALHYAGSGIAMGAALLAFVLVMERLLGHEGLGGGDLKLYAVAGFYFGWQQGLLVVMASCVIGAAAALLAPAPVAVREPDAGGGGVLRRAIPFGPAIAASCLIMMLAGGFLPAWWLPPA